MRLKGRISVPIFWKKNRKIKMLHILLLILKIIGIIIAAILGILVLLICIVLFVPFKYQVEGTCDGTLDGLKADVTCTWLLHLIKFKGTYRQKEFKWRFRVFWKQMAQEAETKENEKEAATDTEDLKDLEGDVITDEEDNKKILEETKETIKNRTEELPGIQEKTEKESQLSERTEKKRKKTSETSSEEKTGNQKEDRKITGFIEKCRQAFQKIKCTIQRFCDKIKALSDKKEKLTSFVSDDVHKTAFLRGKKEAFRLLRRLRPKKIRAKIHYGFDDPCLTGQLLAGLSILYPFIGEQTEIVPDFEHKILEGELLIKGKIRILHFAVMMWNLLWCREVRTTYKHVKSFEL